MEFEEAEVVQVNPTVRGNVDFLILDLVDQGVDSNVDASMFCAVDECLKFYSFRLLVNVRGRVDLCSSWECYYCGYRMRQNLVEEFSRVTAERPELPG